MNEAKEKWMPEIYCLGASTPYAYTWSDVRLDLPGDTCGVDLVNTTSSIVEAKRLGLPSVIKSFSSNENNVNATELSQSPKAKARCKEISHVKFLNASPIKCKCGEAECVAKSTASQVQLYKRLAGLCLRVPRVCSARPCAALGRHPPESRIGDRGQASGRRERSEARPRRTAT
ncbi:hypothetical protein ALC60_00254 [Trachymyrmex zeteki]|uniref:Uncharacterized protein n=1 Tax=Mycetomoellerius zeteki TaxID=64791 RepID=A0A151XJR5_9HYME|nr:hypothetical protein ALC60_00254 [Trachymyrmex zeteki]